MTRFDKIFFDGAKNCTYCKQPFLPDNSNKVRDHDHVTGEYRGAACTKCNLMARRTCKIPIFFHNFRGYDSHFVTQALRFFGGEEIRVIGQGMEKYLTLYLGKRIQFKDSLQFQGSSLQTLANNLLKVGFDKFVHLKEQFVDTPEESLKLLVRKGVYPYEYMDSFERFEEDHLPPKEAFYSKLHGAHISDEDYAHAQSVWNTLNIHTMGEYHDLYLKSMLQSPSHRLLNFSCIHRTPFVEANI